MSVLQPGQRVKVTIDPLGNPKIEAEGFLGVSCEAATANIEQAFAGGGKNITYKDEYHAIPSNEQTLTQGW